MLVIIVSALAFGAEERNAPDAGGTNGGGMPRAGEQWTVPDLGMEFTPIPAGTFGMGSAKTDRFHYYSGPAAVSDEKPVHAVTISRPFWAGKYEVTQSEYEALTRTNPSASKAARQPVEQVSWYDAVAFCRRITEREHSTGRLPSGYEYRLPTEAEWEYCCRAGSRGDYCFGDNEGRGIIDQYALFSWNSRRRTCEVGRLKPNAWGLHDVHGNVWEWCWDWYDPYYYRKSPSIDPVGPVAGSACVARGGSAFNPFRISRAANRNRFGPAVAFGGLGFRVVLAPSIPEQPVSATKTVLATPDTTRVPPAQGRDWTVPDLGMEFVWIDTMNCWVGKYEVTNGEYRRFKPDHDSHSVRSKKKRFLGAKEYSLNGARQPAVYMIFEDACEYAQWLTDREQRAGRLPEGYLYRLPRKDEWTNFSECGDGREFPWGDEWPPKYGNYADVTAVRELGCAGLEVYDDGFAVTCPVEKSGRNDWGLYGVGGNVCEAQARWIWGFDGRRGSSYSTYSRSHMRCTVAEYGADDKDDDSGAEYRRPDYGSGRPFHHWMVGHVDVQVPAAIVGHHNEAVEHAERRGRPRGMPTGGRLPRHSGDAAQRSDNSKAAIPDAWFFRSVGHVGEGGFLPRNMYFRTVDSSA